jgi:hypothetical protein
MAFRQHSIGENLERSKNIRESENRECSVNRRLTRAQGDDARAAAHHERLDGKGYWRRLFIARCSASKIFAVVMMRASGAEPGPRAATFDRLKTPVSSPSRPRL